MDIHVQSLDAVRQAQFLTNHPYQSGFSWV